MGLRRRPTRMAAAATNAVARNSGSARPRPPVSEPVSARERPEPIDPPVVTALAAFGPAEPPPAGVGAVDSAKVAAA